MNEMRQITFGAAGQGDLLSSSDVSGKPSLLRPAAAFPTAFGISMIASATDYDFEVLAGSRTLARGRVPGGGTAGTFPTPTTSQPLGPFPVNAGEELAVNITAGSAASIMAIVERD